MMLHRELFLSVVVVLFLGACTTKPVEPDPDLTKPKPKPQAKEVDVPRAKPGTDTSRWIEFEGFAIAGKEFGPFAIQEHEVTLEAYKRCVDAGVCSAPATASEDYHLSACNWNVKGRSKHPINCVDWKQAKIYCQYLGGKLPHEGEWEWAAREGDGFRQFPWGAEKADCTRAVMDEVGSQPGCGKGTTWPVCSKTAGNTPKGLCDMSGNVGEWVDQEYPNDKRMARGGGFQVHDDRYMNSNIDGRNMGRMTMVVETKQKESIGFRCAK